MKYSESFENKKHGTYSFPIEYYYVDKKCPQYIMPPHWHNDIEIIRVVSGELSVFLNDIEHHLISGDVLFVGPRCLHRGTPSNDCIYECLVFDLTMIFKNSKIETDKYIYPILNGDKSINCILSNDGNEIHNTTNELFLSIKNNSDYYELNVIFQIFRVIYKLYQLGYVTTPTKNTTRQVKNISHLLEWIEENLSKQITLDSLSKISGYSNKYLCNIFKTYTSKTPIDYINYLRIENACMIMTNTDKSITEIAFECGFHDLSYFSKTFKNNKGVPPKEYKKQFIYK